MIEGVARHDLGLRHAPQRGELRQDQRHEAPALEQSQRAGRRRIPEHPQQLVADALGRDGRHGGSQFTDRLLGSRIDGQSEAAGEARGADQPQRVLAEPFPRISDCPQHAGGEVAHTVVRIDHPSAPALEIDREPGHGVDGEVAARQVLFDAGTEADVVGTAAIAIATLGAVRRDLHGRSAKDGDGAEAVLPGRIVEERGDLLRSCRGGSIPVVRGPHRLAPQPVADDAADQGRLVAGIAERPQHAANLRRQVGVGQLTVGCHAGGPQPA